MRTSRPQSRRILRETGLAPDLLELEVTEDALFEDVDVATRALQALKALGVRLVLDDFGTGFSSLGYLKRLPIDALKIDRSFVPALGRDGEDVAIVDAVRSGLQARSASASARWAWKRMLSSTVARARVYVRAGLPVRPAGPGRGGRSRCWRAVESWTWMRSGIATAIA